MGRKEKTIHYIYKTICLITNRYYIGMHSTSDLDDGYMGSGKRLRNSIRKHGVENHKKEILEFFATRELLIEAEIKTITPEMIGDSDCMNLMGGGTGGFISVEQQRYRSICGGNVHKKRMETDVEYRLKTINNVRFNFKKAHREGKFEIFNWTGLKHSEESKQKMSESSKGKGIGNTNSQYGTCWITNGKEVKKIKKEEIDWWLSVGWVKGRKIGN